MAFDEPQQGSQPSYPGPMVPPTQAGPVYDLEPPSKWPVVVGIIAIVLSALGLLGGVCGMVMMTVAKPLMQNMPNMPAGALEITPTLIATTAVNLGLSVMLLVVGIGFLKRRAWSARLGMVWAIVDIVAVIVNVAVAPRMAAAQSGGQAEAVGASIGMVCGATFGLVFPVFLLIWLSRAKIKQEVASW